MITIVLSDLHIGDRRVANKYDKIIHLLDGYFDRLVLNGDIFDMWLESDVERLAESDLTKKLASISKEKETYWVRGNHDHDAIKIRSLLPCAQIVDKVKIRDANKSVLIMHGHQVCAFESRAWYSKILSKFVVWFDKVFGVDLQLKARKISCYQDLVRKNRSELVQKYGSNVDCVVSGHSHMIGFAHNDNTQLYDAGSTAFTQTYIEINNDLIYLRKL